MMLPMPMAITGAGLAVDCAFRVEALTVRIYRIIIVLSDTEDYCVVILFRRV